MQESKGLRNMGIIALIMGIIDVILYVASLSGLESALKALGANDQVSWFASWSALVLAIIEVYAGIIAIRNWNKPEKASGCAEEGVEMILFVIVNLVCAILAFNSTPGLLGSYAVPLIISTIISLVIPVVYTVFAYKFYLSQVHKKK
jgi:hypothetical protein